MTGILLAGGKSKRMGTDKPFLEFNGKFLYQYPLSVLESFCDEILISTSDNRFKKTGHTLVEDEIMNTGPAGGIYSCLRKSGYNSCAVLSCDMPYMNPIYFYELSKAKKDSFAAVGLNDSGQVEPLAGIYDKSLEEIFLQQILKGDFKLVNLLNKTRVSYMMPDPEKFDARRLFVNLNRPEDLLNN